ncbi:hypothetical protein [Kineococcus radiotolerans]|uniref:Uncharacterized protein n=1 Tax=Kineococcus radiotolerans (strain ATCC BAA-149 / DSM 14245 / SRS30216) TaxID=266940 RepID=A6W8P0_KINRD|nr:hypothetical protein [Kineococcus radiotolerans]ABS03179.1 hypothetical protein Krad_1693 [Kineococcus radiotolerans SRS30216 = ATCC BAA-149]
MFGKKDDDGDGKTRVEKAQKLLDPAFVNRQWSVQDAPSHMRDVMRAYEQIKLTEKLIAEQQETNRLLQLLVDRQA